MRTWTWTVMLAAAAAMGCGDSDGSSTTGGTGGTGIVGGTGMVGGTGGTMAGMGVSGMGVSGTGASGTGATGTVKTCADYAASGAARGTHDAVAVILRGDGVTNMNGGCAFSSCHTGASPRATLDLTTDPNITTALVNVPACQTTSMVRVTPGDPANSWLWIKLTGPFDPTTGAVTHTATAQNCAHTEPAGTLGGSMPWTGGGAPIPLPDDQLYQICTWIEDGAVGP